MIGFGRALGSNVASIVKVKSGSHAMMNNNVMRAMVPHSFIYSKKMDKLWLSFPSVYGKSCIYFFVTFTLCTQSFSLSPPFSNPPPPRPSPFLPFLIFSQKKAFIQTLPPYLKKTLVSDFGSVIFSFSQQPQKCCRKQ